MPDDKTIHTDDESHGELGCPLCGDRGELRRAKSGLDKGKFYVFHDAPAPGGMAKACVVGTDPRID